LQSLITVVLELDQNPMSSELI